MLKTKLGSIALACMLGCATLNPVYAFAAETKTESVTLSEKDQNKKDKKIAFEESMKKATDQWNTLSDKQKNEVFALIENEMKAQIQLFDKFAELGIISKDDATAYKTRLMQRFSEMKKSGEFPFARPKRSK